MEHNSEGLWQVEGGAALPDSGMAQLQERLHPHALLVHWEIYVRSKEWRGALAVAQALIVNLPGQPIGWIYRSFALQQLGQLSEAWSALRPAASRFPDDWRIAYNLACYSCQLGDKAEAWHWLDRAIELGDADLIKSLALDDPNFRPLWQRLGKL